MDRLDLYFENTQKPWGQLFYKSVWSQLSFARGLKILDFGSGFGITASHLAAHNNVIAVEPNEKMCERRILDNPYEQIIGNINSLSSFPGNSFDLIVCHNVLEYIENKEIYFDAFSNLLKPNGKLSLVKHNHVGRTMQRIVFENNLELAIKELNGQTVASQDFGDIGYYSLDEIESWSEIYKFKHMDLFGVRIFFGLIQNNEIKSSFDWQKNMLILEQQVCRNKAFCDIAFFHHLILQKMS